MMIMVKVRNSQYINNTTQWLWFDLIVFNATFSNISTMSWWPVLMVEEAGVPERTTDHGQTTGKFITWGCESSAPFCNLQGQVRTHAVLVLGLYELLGNPTT
jgi:hypothetical protein